MPEPCRRLPPVLRVRQPENIILPKYSRVKSEPFECLYSDVITGTGISVSFHLAPTLVYLLRDYSNRVVPDLHSLRRQLDAKNDHNWVHTRLEGRKGSIVRLFLIVRVL